MGQRVRNVVAELHGEKIDIIDYDEDPATFVGNALSPAHAQQVTVVDPVAKAARVVVPDYQLSLAIGREGQNARLAARLTGWRIDIHSDAEADAVEAGSGGAHGGGPSGAAAPQQVGAGPADRTVPSEG
jgi:N utilization substance protein A